MPITKAKIIKQEEHSFTSLKERHMNRKVHLVQFIEGESGKCICCKRELNHTSGPFIGVEYTYDAEQLTELCLNPCAIKMGIISEDNKPSTVAAFPQKQIQYAKKVTIKTNKEGGSDDMKLDLKDRLKATKPVAATPAEEEPKKGLTLEEDEDEESEIETIEEKAPWKSEASSVDNGKKTPLSLKAKVESIDAQKPGTTLTKADIQDVVDTCLAEFEKKTAIRFRDIKTDIAKSGAEALSQIKAQFDTVIGGLHDLGERLNEAAGEEAVETQTKTAPTTEASQKRGPGRPPGSKNKAKEEPVSTPTAPAAPTNKPPKLIDFIKEQMDPDGLDLEAVADAIIELGILKPDSVPEDRDEYLKGLAELLTAKGCTIKNGVIKL